MLFTDIPFKTKAQRDKLRSVMLAQFPSDEEHWAFHPRAEQYIVSTKGRIKNIITGNMIVQRSNIQGYQMVNAIFFKVGRRHCMVHRMVAETFLPYCFHEEQRYEVNHIDGDKNNNTLENLEWVTRQENIDHIKVLNKTRPKHVGSRSNCKIKDKDVLDMRELFMLGFSIGDIAKAYNTCRSYTGRIVKKQIRLEVL